MYADFRTRVLKICHMCGFSDRTMKLLQESGEAHERAKAMHNEMLGTDISFSKQNAFNLQECLPACSDVARLNLARALVINPEVLVMHMPCISFTDVENEDMMKLI